MGSAYNFLNYLRFQEEIEKRFREYYYEQSIRPFRINMIFGAISFASFVPLDLLSLPESWQYICIVRVIMCSVAFLAIFLSYRNFFKNNMQLAISVLGVMSGFAILTMILISDPSEPGYQYYYGGLFLVIIAVSTMLRLRFRYATAVNLAIIASYEIIALFYQDLLGTKQGFISYVSNNFFLVFSIILGEVACYNMEFLTRSDFSRQKEIENELKQVETSKMQLEEVIKSGKLLDDKVINDICEIIDQNLAEIKGTLADLDSLLSTDLQRKLLLKITDRCQELDEVIGEVKDEVE